MNILDENTLAVVVVVGLLIGIIAIRAIIKSIFSAKPPATFRCVRCRREVPHDKRTIEAWRSGKSATINGVKRIRQYVQQLATAEVVACCL